MSYPVVRRFRIRKAPPSIDTDRPWRMTDNERELFFGRYATWDLAMAAAANRLRIDTAEKHYLGEDLKPECGAPRAQSIGVVVARAVTCPACLAEIKTHADRRVA